MVELLAFVIAAVIVAVFWRLFASLAVVAMIGAAILAGIIALNRADHSVQAPAPQASVDGSWEAAQAPRFALYRDDSRTAYPEQVLVGTYPTRGACQRAGEKLSYLADRVEVHYCREVTR